MDTMRKNVYEGLSRNQVLARVTRRGRGKAVMDRLAAIPASSKAEIAELERELGALMTAVAKRDQQAALDRGDFWREPGPRQWPSTVFTTADESSGFGKSLSKALGGIK